MADRYFSETPITGERAELLAAEAHHLAHVLRAKPGDEVLLFDGGGCEFAARVEKVARNRVDLSGLERREVDRELRVEIVLGVGLPKGDRQRWLVEKLTELGVARLVPLETTRGVARPTENALQRLRRSVIEASKQCGRNRLMEIAPPQSWQQFLAAAPQTAVHFVAHPESRVARPESAMGVSVGDANTPFAALRDVPPATETSAPTWLAVGPEGGFTDDEIAAARAAGWQVIDLGPRILRVETAAIVLATLAAARV